MSHATPPPLISIIAPMYNEAQGIAEFVRRVASVCTTHNIHYECLLVDDGSHDASVSIAKGLQANIPALRILCLSRNYGHEIAMTAGLEHAKGDYAILMDSDCQHPPELIPELLAKAYEGFDVVYASRTNRETQSWLKRQLSRAFYKVAKTMTGLQMSEDAGNYRVLSRKVIESLTQITESNRHLLMLFAYVGFKTASVPYVCQPRFAGKSTYSYRKLVNLAIDSIISFSHRPLRYMSILAVMISLLMTAYAGFIVLEKLFAHQTLADGMASVIFIISGLFAILFLFLAILSEYISRILVESKNRPLYYIKQEFAKHEDL